MSETEIKLGKLIPVKIEESLEKTILKIFEEDGHKKEDWIYDTPEQEFRDNYYEKYITIGDKLFKIQIDHDDPYDNIYHLVDNGDGTFDFVVKYYNGSCSFNEAIEEAMKKQNGD